MSKQLEDEKAALVEALFYGYKVLGFDTDDCKDGACFLAHTGPGGHNLDGFIRLMKSSFDEARADADEAMQENAIQVAGLRSDMQDAMADAWDEGATAGLGWDETRGEDFSVPNPYRSQP